MGSNASALRKWRRLLELGKELMTQPRIATQQQLILQAATNLAGGEAALWLNEELRGLLDKETPALPSEPPSTTMRRALQSTSPIVEDVTVALPLQSPESVLGILEIKRPEGPGFDDEELALLQGLATQAAAALQAGRQVAVERWRLDQLSLVRTVSAEVANVLDLDELARRVANLVLTTFGYYHAALFTLESDEETLLCRASAGPTRSGAKEDERCPAPSVRVGQGIVGRVAETGQEILAGDVSREPHYRYVDVLPETRSEAALPLKIEDRVLGVLDVQSDQPDRFDETDVLVLRALADQIAIAVEDARLYSVLRRRADQLSAVTEVSRAVASVLDLDELLNEVVALIHKQFDYPFVHLFTVDLVQQKILYRAGWPSRDRRAFDEGKPVCSLTDTEGIVAWVACHGETVLSNDVRSDPRYRPLPVPSVDARAELAVPLVFGGEVLGMLDVQSDRPHAFSDDDRFVFEGLADSVAIAIRNANLYQSERWRRQVADSMRDVAGLLSSGVELDEVLDAILTKLEELLPCDASAIWLLQDDTLCISAAHGTTERACVSDSLLDAKAWLRQALLADRPLVRSPATPPEPLGASLGFPSDYSAIAAPLRAGDQRLGLLTLAHRTPGRYGSESRMMTAAFASYAAVAIENTRLYQTAQEQAYISTVLLQVAEATQSLVTLEEVLDTVVRLMPMLVGVERCALFLWDESEQLFVPAGACGLGEEQRRTFDRLRIAPGDVPAFNQLRIVKGPVFVESSPDATYGALPSPLDPFESPLLLPLLAHGEVLGAMLIDYETDQDIRESPDLHEERMAIMRGIAYQAAAAAENARLLEARQEEAYVSAALLQVAQAVVSLNDLDDILEAIVRVTPMLVGVEQCTIFLWSDDEEVFRVGQSYGASVPDHPFAPGEFPLLDAVRTQNELITLDDLDEIGDLVPRKSLGELLAQPPGKMNALLAAPLSVKGNVLGAMLIGESDRSPGLGERRLEIITGIAQQAAMAVQNDLLQQEMAERERLERELQLAREIQETFMPERLPDLPGWELAVTWRAARQVAGDFYDVFELPEKRLGLVIADVADKGMPAALFMALTRTLMRAASTEERSPADALKRVNNLLVPDARHGMFVTGLYVILSLETGKIVYANAGHHPPLVLRSGVWGPEQLERGETALGVLEDVQFRDHVDVLAARDVMILYTDGVIEALSPDGVFYGDERLREVIQTTEPDVSAGDILTAVIDSIAAFVGDNPPSDDLTLMVVRRQEA
jgi:GAF domain-containing protein